MTWELVPIGIHRRNVAEKTKQTFKGNFKYIACGVADEFPMNMWDRLIPQAELMCNLLYQSNVAPKLLAQAYAFGPHDFNWMPLAPMGCAVQIHENRVSVERGVSTQFMDGTSRHCHTAICDLRYGVNTQEQSEFWTLCFLNTTHITNTTVSPEYAAVQAAKEST